MQVEVVHKESYGRDFFYPKNEFAKALCRLMDTVSFTAEKLALCENAGWEVVITKEVLNLKDYLRKKNQECTAGA